MRTRAGLAGFAALLVVSATARAGEEDASERATRLTTAQADESRPEAAAAALPTSAREAAAAAPLPVYKLPSVGKPRRRVGGGRRGGANAGPVVTALVPEHVGLTARERPSVYWWLGGPAQAGARFEVALADADAIDPLVERALPAPLAPGLQRIDLAALGVSLAIGPEYQWSVALVVDPEQRSRDVVTTGWIRRVAVASPAANDAASNAARGLWYDALDAAARDPAGADAVAALLSQVGLEPLEPPAQ